MKQQNKLLIIIVSIIVLSIIGSVIVNLVWFQSVDREISYIGLDLPTGNAKKIEQASIQKGAQLFLDEFNQSNKLKTRLFQLKPLNSPSTNFDSELKSVLAVIANKTFIPAKTQALYQKSSLAMINHASTLDELTKNQPWLYSNMFSSEYQAKFIANYTRNVLGKKIVTLIHADSEKSNGMAENFTEVYARFGTKIHYTFPFNPLQAEQSFVNLINEIKEKKDLGMIVIVASANESASFITKARDAGIRNLMVGTDSTATAEFKQAISQFAQNKEDIARYTNKLVSFSPLLFDTAGMSEQNFKNSYIQHHGVEPDWLAAYGYGSAKLIINGILNAPETANNLEAQQKAIREYLNSLNSEKKPLSGVLGKTWFSQTGQRNVQVQAGIYNGLDIIAAPTQLQPIKKNSVVNFIEELKQGKMLYVNDRFMYKTNVIYTGIEMQAINKVDFDAETVELDFSIWFRYQGKFDPSLVTFLNAEVGAIKFGEPVAKLYENGVTYELYEVKGQFNLNFSTEKRQYGNHLLGISFYHETLNNNNVIYVADVLGMAFDEKIGLKEKLYNNVASHPPTGWKVDKAWLSQSTVENASQGAPAYIGYNSIESLYSQIDYGILIKEDKFDFRDFIPASYFIYLGILGLIGSIAAYMIDKKFSGYFWLTSSWIMRVAFWPMILISLTNVGIDLAVEYDMPIYYLEQMILGFESLGYWLFAVLIVIAVERFIWTPLEKKTGNKIPGLIRHCSHGLIYISVGLAMVAFVFGQSLTSLLATGGVFAMIIGLAVKSNVANIFSGVLISIEKSFVVGDWIKINQVDNVQIVDMTWRTMRVQNSLKNVISIPNGKVAVAQVVNYSVNNSTLQIMPHISSKYAPDLVLENLKQALLKVEGIHDLAPPKFILYAINEFYIEYQVRFTVDDHAKQGSTKDKVWKAIYRHFAEKGISFESLSDEELKDIVEERNRTLSAVDIKKPAQDV